MTMTKSFSSSSSSSSLWNKFAMTALP
jgi:hypothetical protein